MSPCTCNHHLPPSHSYDYDASNKVLFLEEAVLRERKGKRAEVLKGVLTKRCDICKWGIWRAPIFALVPPSQIFGQCPTNTSRVTLPCLQTVIITKIYEMDQNSKYRNKNAQPFFPHLTTIVKICNILETTEIDYGIDPQDL